MAIGVAMDGEPFNEEDWEDGDGHDEPIWHEQTWITRLLQLVVPHLELRRRCLCFAIETNYGEPFAEVTTTAACYREWWQATCGLQVGAVVGAVTCRRKITRCTSAVWPVEAEARSPLLLLLDWDLLKAWASTGHHP